MWRKQPEAKPSSPVNPSPRESSYAPPAQKPASPIGGMPNSAPQLTHTLAPSSNAAVLTRGIRIKGELTGKADLLIDGDVEGSIRLGDSRLTVGQAGHIKADIEAAEIVVRGMVDGDLRGRDRVVLGSSSHVEGDLEAPRVAIEDGARFNGRVEMGPAADARERQNKRASQFAAPRDKDRDSSASDADVNLPVALETHRS
jgi:cytoskeletal protein CcmA (bactofilin family)